MGVVDHRKRLREDAYWVLVVEPGSADAPSGFVDRKVDVLHLLEKPKRMEKVKKFENWRQLRCTVSLR